MSRTEISPGLHFFGNLVDLDCHMQDLKLVLRKTEEIEFPEHEESNEGESLIADIFPDITRKSFIVTLLIALDDQFKTYCEILRAATGQKLKWNDLKGSALERFITYSEKVCGLRPVCDESTRLLLEGLIEVRNCIVHNNSSVEGFNKTKAIQRFARQMKGVDIEEGYISIDFAACNTCADIVLRFMEHAYRSALKAFPYEH
jgi:ATP phosphoribosyltransferase